MAQLTWRDVAAPNLGNPQDSINAAAKLLASSTGGLSGALTQFGDQQALQQLAGYSDAQKLQADIQSGRFNTANASPEALADIMKRPASLIADQSNQQMANYRKELNPLLIASQQGQNSAVAQKLLEDQYGHNRTVDNNVTSDAARPLVNKLLSEATGQDLSGFTALPADVQTNLATGLVSAKRTNITNTKADTDEANRKAALVLLQDIQKNVAGPDGARQALAAIPNPEVAALVQQGLGGNFGTLYGSKAEVDPVNAIQSTDDPLNPVNTQNNLWAALTKQESGGKQFNKDGTVVTSPKGATGIAQIMPTSGPEAAKLAGLPWNPALFSRKATGDPVKDEEAAKYNEALGQAYLSQQLKEFGSGDKALAAYNAGPGATRKAIASAAREGNPDAWLSYLPEETRKYVPAILSNAKAPPAGESRTPAMAARLLEQSVTENAFQKVANDPTGLYKDIEANANNNAPAAEVANLVTGPKGILAGEDSGRVLDQINSITRATGVTPAQAVDMIVRNSERNDWTTKIDWFTPGSTTKLGDGRVVRDTKLAEDIARYQNKDTLRAYRANKDIDAENATVAAAIQAQTAAEELYKRAKGLQGNAGFKAQLPALEQDVLKKRSKVAELLQRKATVSPEGTW